MTDGTPTRAQRFAALVVPAAERAGYTGHGAKARFARDTGMTESSVTRMWQGNAVPDARFYDAISQVTGIDLGALLVMGGVLSPKSLRSLSETDRSQVRSALTPEEAKKVNDWALTAEMQSKAKDVKSFQIPSNKQATPSPLSPDLSTIKLIDYDFKKYGSSDERKRLLQKWDTEVSSLPQ